MMASREYPYKSLRANRGKICIGGCPGTGGRKIQDDLESIRESRIETIVTLLDWTEVRMMGVPHLHIEARKAGLNWYHFSFPAGGVPPIERFGEWNALCDVLQKVVGNFGSILIHCQTGHEKAKLVAGMLLQEFDFDPIDAISAIEKLGPGFELNDEQADFVYRYRQWGLDH